MKLSQNVFSETVACEFKTRSPVHINRNAYEYYSSYAFDQIFLNKISYLSMTDNI